MLVKMKQIALFRSRNPYSGLLGTVGA